MILSLVNRVDIPRITEHIRATNPHAFFSIEDVRYVNEGRLCPRKPQRHHRVVPFVHPPEKEKIISPDFSGNTKALLKEKPIMDKT